MKFLSAAFAAVCLCLGTVSLRANPGATVPLAQALGYNDAPWTTGGDAAWTSCTAYPGTEGGDAAFAPLLTSGQEAWIETTFTGSGILRWRWLEDGRYYLMSRLNGLPLTGLIGGTIARRPEGWQEEQWRLPPGTHTVRWLCTVGGDSPGLALLDSVSFTPEPPPPWSEELGPLADTFVFRAGSTVNWVETLTDGQSALLANQTIEGIWDRSSSLQVDVTGPAFLSWSHRSSDGIATYLDGNPSGVLSAGDADVEVSLVIPAGRHRLGLEPGSRWNWINGETLPGWMTVRQFAVTPLTVVPLEEALEATNMTIFNDPVYPWQGLRGPGTAPSDDFAYVGADVWTPSAIEVECVGPGRLTGSWAASPYVDTYCGLVSARVGDELLGEWRPGIDGQMEIILSPGVQRVRLERQSCGQAARLETLQFEPWNLPLATAADAPGFTISTGPDGWWAGSVRPDLAQQGNSLIYGHGAQGAWLETEVAGPATFTCWWRLDAGAGTAVALTLDGAPIVQQPYSNGSGMERIRIPSGTHRLRWTWQNFSAERGRLNAFLLDHFVLTPQPALTLGEAADLPDFSFTSSGDGHWTAWTQPEVHAGGDLIEGRISATEPGPRTLLVAVAVNGPGVLRGWRLMPLENSSLTILLDGKNVVSFWSQGAWQPFQLVIPPGAHSIDFRFDGNYGSHVWLDDFTWNPTNPSATLASAVEGSGLSNWSTGAPGDWFPIEDAELAADGVDALFASYSPAAPRLLRAQADGPGTLSFRGYAPPEMVGFAADGFGYPAVVPGVSEPWSQRVVFLGNPGTHQLHWTLAAAWVFDAGNARLDQIHFTPAAPVPLDVALDQPGRIFRTSSAAWAGASSSGGAGGHLGFVNLDATVPPGMEQWIETDLPGPGKVYFDFFQPGNSGSITGASPASYGYTVAGRQSVRWSITQPATPLTATATLDNLIYQPATWAAWQEWHFPAGTPAAQIAFDADPDGDGVVNGMEAALGTNPRAPDAASPVSVIKRSGWVPVTYVRTARSLPEHLTVELEYAGSPSGPWTLSARRSGDTGGWQTGSYTQESNTPPHLLHTSHFISVPAPASRLYCRLKVRLQP